MYKTNFEENDFVWAKMAGHPFWPAIICKPAESKNNMQWVYFLGSHNYGWIEDNDKKLKPYEINKSKYRSKRCKTAMNELDEIVESFAENPNYQFTFPTCTPKSRSSVLKKPRKKTAIRAGRKRAASAMSADSVSSGNFTEEMPNNKAKKKFVPHETAENYYLNNDDNNENNEEEEEVETVDTEQTLIDNGPHIVDTTTITASDKIFAFLVDDNVVLCEGIVKNLLKSGHCIHFYSGSKSQRDNLRKYAQGKEVDFIDFDSMQEAVRDCDIVLNCMNNSKSADEIVKQFKIDFSNNLLNEKIYVQMSNIDVKTSRSLKEKLEEKGATYFEALLQGTKIDAETANLMVLCAGSQEVYLECQSCFKSIAKRSFLVGDVGVASSLHQLFQMIRGSFLAALCEGFSLADRSGLKLGPFSTIFKETGMAGNYLSSVADVIEKKKYLLPKDAFEPIYQLQNDISKGLDLANTFNQPMPLISKTNEFFKQARRMGCDSLDSACIFRSV